MALAAAGVGAAVQLCAAVSYAPPAAWVVWVVVICDAVAVASFFCVSIPPAPMWIDELHAAGQMG